MGSSSSKPVYPFPVPARYDPPIPAKSRMWKSLSMKKKSSKGKDRDKYDDFIVPKYPAATYGLPYCAFIPCRARLVYLLIMYRPNCPPNILCACADGRLAIWRSTTNACHGPALPPSGDIPDDSSARTTRHPARCSRANARSRLSTCIRTRSYIRPGHTTPALIFLPDADATTLPGTRTTIQ